MKIGASTCAVLNDTSTILFDENFHRKLAIKDHFVSPF